MNERIKHFIIGLVAGSIALALSFLLRILAGGLFIPELAAQTLFSLTPGEIESQAVTELGSLAKYSTFAGAIVLNIFLYGVIGVFLHSTYTRLARKGYFVNLLQLSLIPYSVLLVLAVILLEVTEVLTQPISIQLVSLYLIPPHAVFGIILYYMFQIQAARPEITYQNISPEEQRIDFRKRQFLRVAIAGAIVSVVFFSGTSFLLSRPTKPSDGTQQAEPSNELVMRPEESPRSSGDIFADLGLAPLIASEVTPNHRFYTVDTNLVTPTVDANTWKLKVKGLVNIPLELTYEELKSMPAVEDYATLECISNKIGENLISTALWKGIPLKDILHKAQVKPEAVYIVFRCHDGYDVGIPLERGIEGTVLAFEMNGVTLPAEHGFPVRAVVHGLYGMMNAKWITEIELVDKVYEGFWQRRGWANNAQYQTHSTIVLPGGALTSRFGNLQSPRIVAGSTVPITGIAFAGDRGVSKIEVSTDDGKSWETARMKDPLSKNTWVLWAVDWKPPAEGKYRITVRATDKTGKVQIVEPQKPFPSGSTGYHSVDVTTVAS